MLEQIKSLATSKIAKAGSIEQLQDCRIEFLGKSSLLQQKMRTLNVEPVETRRMLGQQLNAFKKHIQLLLDQQEDKILRQERAVQLQREKIDITVPARPQMCGSIHPITQCIEELTQIFLEYGFNIKTGPDIETVWYNFTALNIAQNHPARQMHDTFYFKQGVDSTDDTNDNDDAVTLLRTHTSPVEIRTMQSEQPPHRFISPGRTYRADSDITHTPMFHQIEGLVIEQGIHMGHLKWILTNVIRKFFDNKEVEVRLRPSFFPFTVPSAEVDIRLGRDEQWLEVLGAGMIHPDVLRNVGLDPKEHQGFAFGLGVERFAMLKYGIRDLRQFFEGDMRWLKHYNFKVLDIPILMKSRVY